MRQIIYTAIAVVTLSLCVTARAQDLLVRGGTVVTMAGETLEGGSVLIKSGRIAQVGMKIEADGVPVLDAKGRIVMPSFVLAHTSQGMDRENENLQVAPFVTVRDGIDPSRTFFENSLRDGHLAMLIMPGRNTVVGGRGTVLQPYGLTIEHMTLKEDVGMKLSMVPRGGNRAAHLAQLREALDKGKLALENAKARKSDDVELTGNWEIDLQRLSIARQQRPLIKMLEGELRPYIHCQTAGDVMRALRLSREYGLRPALVVGAGCWRAASMLARSRAPIVLEPPFEVEETDPQTGEKVRRNIPKILHDAGVKFAVTTRNSLGERYLWYQAASLVRAGLSREDALAAVTTNAARFAGMGKRLGSLEKGKDGTLVLWTADPLSGRAWVDVGVSRGQVIYRRSADPRLAEVFGEEGR